MAMCFRFLGCVVLFLAALPGGGCEGGVESSRLVVTFRAVKDNNITGVDFGDVTVVKQYGRRLVLDLGVPFNLDIQRGLYTAKLRSVQSVEVDYLVNVGQADFTVSDALLVANATDPSVEGAAINPASQTPLWNLKDSEPYSIHAEGVWQVTNSTPGVVVAVVDTGMAELARPMFLNLLDGYDFISDDGISVDGDGHDPDSTDPGDWGDMCPTPSWHGTKVASILAARHDNEFGMKGVAQNCSVLPVRVLGLCRMGYATDVTDAIVWSAGGAINGVPDNPTPAKIISLSLAGQGTCPDYLQSAITQAVGLGSVIIAAAGNNNQNASGYFPANCNGVIAVAASTRDGRLAGYSNWGVQIIAPGGDYANAIMTLGVNELETGLEVSYGMGTSFAAPHLSGIHAFLNVRENVTGIFEFGSLLTPINETCPSTRCSQGNIITGINTRFVIGSSFTTASYGVGSFMGNPYSVSKTFVCNPPLFIKTVEVGLSGDAIKRAYFTCSDDTTRSTAFGDEYLYNELPITSTSGINSFTYCSDKAWLQGFGVNCINSGGTSETLLKQWGRTPSSSTCSYVYGTASCGAPDSLGLDYLITGITGHYFTGGGFGGFSLLCDSFTCTSGQYLYTADRTCRGCPGCASNTYQSVACSGTNYGTCSPCGVCSGSNYWSAPCGGSSAGTCAPCTCTGANYWSAACGGSSAGTCSPCAACGAGNYWSAACGGNSAGVCGSCTAGYYCAGGTNAKQQCTAGYYCTGGNIVQTACAAGKYSAVVGSTTANDCQSCAAGKYSTVVGSTTANDCQSCAAGKYSTTVGSSSASNCQPCAAGSYTSTAGLIVCTPCSVGTYNASTGATVCTNCTAGYYNGSTGATACTGCSAGTYSGSGASSCTNCPPGTTSFNVAPSCTPCIAGTYSISTIACDFCAAGKYSAAVGASSSATCTPCPAGNYSSSAASTSCPACVSPNYCAANSTAQNPCPAGSYCPNASTIFTCPQNAYCPASSTTPTLCPAGTKGIATGAFTAANCVNCTAGTFSGTNGSIVCGGCAAGSYAASSGSTACKVCTPIQFCTSGLNLYIKNCTSTTDAYCADCSTSYSKPLNSYWIENSVGACFWKCNIGYFNSSNVCQLCRSQSSCGIGQYATTCTGNADGVCSLCTNGPSNSNYTSTSNAYDSPTGCSWSCNAGFSKSTASCVQCTAGSYSIALADTCSSCSVGTYAATAGLSVCSSCPAGTYLNTTGAQSSASCLPCAAGKYSTSLAANSSATCLSCLAGTYSANQAAVSSGACLLCSTGTYASTTGLSACTNCSAGTYLNTTGASSASPCIPCNAGKYSSNQAATSSAVCLSCSAGTYSNATTGFSACTPCSLNYYTPTLGAAICTPCPLCTSNGYYTDGCSGTSPGTCKQCNNTN